LDVIFIEFNVEVICCSNFIFTVFSSELLFLYVQLFPMLDIIEDFNEVIS